MTSSLPFADLLQVPWNEYARNLGIGLVRTLGYTVASFIGATVLGLGLALMRLNHLRVVRVPAALYTEIFKNVPLLAIISSHILGCPRWASNSMSSSRAS